MYKDCNLFKMLLLIVCYCVSLFWCALLHVKTHTLFQETLPTMYISTDPIILISEIQTRYFPRLALKPSKAGSWCQKFVLFVMAIIVYHLLYRFMVFLMPHDFGSSQQPMLCSSRSVCQGSNLWRVSWYLSYLETRSYQLKYSPVTLLLSLKPSSYCTSSLLIYPSI